MQGPAIVTRVPDHQRILVVSTAAEEAELLAIKGDLGRHPVVLSAPTPEAAQVLGKLGLEPLVDALLAPVSSTPADRGHRLDTLVRRHALQDRFRTVVVVSDKATSTLLVGSLAPDQVPSRSDVTVVGLPRGQRPMAARRAVVWGLALGVAAGMSGRLMPIPVLPAAVAVLGLLLLVFEPWRRIGRELVLAAAVAITAVVALVAGSARFPGNW